MTTTTVLCIDDDVAVLEMLKAVLESRGYVVLTASDGGQGVSIGRKHTVDVVVLDFNMTGMDGHQTAVALLKWRPTLPVVVFSGAVDLPESLKWFADVLVYKSDGPTALLAAIEKVAGSVQQSPRLPRLSAATKEQLSA